MKLSDLSDEDWFKRLSARRNANTAQIRDWWQRYDGERLHLWVSRLLAEQDDRFPALTINWHEKFIDTIDRRCITEGFRLPGSDEFDEDLWKIWRRNDLPEFESENNVASLVTGVSYMVVGPSDEGALITVESPDQMAIEIDPRTRKTVASLLFYKSDQNATTDDRAVLQVAGTNGSRMVEFENGKPVGGGQTMKWMSAPAKLQSSPDVPVVRFLNRQRQRVGRSELRALAPLTDAADLIATHMLATSHFHAMPRMLAIDVAEAMFFNDDGSINRDAVKSATGTLWVVPAEADDDGKTLPKDEQGPTPDIKQLPAADLRNFHESLSSLGRIGAGLCDMNPAQFGFGVADNPASADGIRAAKEDMTTRVERVHVSRGAGYARVMRLSAAVEGRDPAGMELLETIWRDPSKPTKSAMADAATKTYAAGISDLHQARVDYGYTATTIAAMEAREEAAGVREDDAFNRANRPLTDDGSAVNSGNA
ncbi:phage portal protein [Aeromicrobium sp. 9AM]|uniref:phage portal protein n=1 Tax=Aeromicrobium sp. 9AM TaxID=2653126 RepID=UPI0012F0BB4C|nr:phage portal protein [Aeromicrobium sp. 9AM]VXC08280.1 Phage portal protein, SPP1 Gp6 [Aeromicrobium sp. 9AM]